MKKVFMNTCISNTKVTLFTCKQADVKNCYCSKCCLQPLPLPLYWCMEKCSPGTFNDVCQVLFLSKCYKYIL